MMADIEMGREYAFWMVNSEEPLIGTVVETTTMFVEVQRKSNTFPSIVVNKLHIVRFAPTESKNAAN